jgi:hypothetical protein
MASTYSTDLKLELMATGENAGTWGTKTNANLNLIQQAIAGYELITLTDGAATALVMNNASISNARNMVLKFATITLTSATTVTIPDSIEKFYIFDCSLITNPTNLTIKTATGTGFTLDSNKIYAAYADGTNLNEVSLDTLGGTVGTTQIANDAVTNDKVAANAIDTAEIVDDAVTNAKVAADAINTSQLVDDAVTQAKIANNAVGSDQLANDAVTNAKVANNAIDTAEIANDAVTNAKVANDAIDTAEIVNDAVTNSKIANDAVDTAQLVNNAVTADKLERKFTISTSNPSGGSDGDIWFKYT